MQHVPDPDSPTPPIVIANDKAHIRIDIAGMASAIMMVRSLRLLQKRMRASGDEGYAVEIDRILTEWEVRK